jgi:hypothetical protein
VTLAYVILAHRLPDQLGRLVSTMYHEDDLFLIHIDAKVSSAPFRAEMDRRFGSASNIEFVSPVRCDWAGFGHVDATLRGIDQALARSSGFTHLLLLTGQDYPIKPIGRIRTHFEEHRGQSFMSWSAGDAGTESNRRGNQRWFWDGDLTRLELRHYLIRGRWRHVPNRFVPFFPRRRTPLGFRPYQGLAYWNLSIEAVRYVQQLRSTNPEAIRFFRRVWGTDEFFFQMVLINSPLRDSIVNEDLRYMAWEGYHPLTIRSADLRELARSSKFFARKFDSSVDAEVLDMIDSTLL